MQNRLAPLKCCKPILSLYEVNVKRCTTNEISNFTQFPCIFAMRLCLIRCSPDKRSKDGTTFSARQEKAVSQEP